VPRSPTLDRESIASQCMDIHRNPLISKWISIEAWIIKDWYPKNIDIHLWIFIVYGYPLRSVFARISVLEYPCGYPRLYGWLKTHPKIMDIHVDIRGFLEIHAWICYGFSDQGGVGYEYCGAPHAHNSIFRIACARLFRRSSVEHTLPDMNLTSFFLSFYRHESI